MNNLTPATLQLLTLVAVSGAPLLLMGQASSHPHAGTVTHLAYWLTVAAAAVLLVIAARNVARDLRQ